jgi:hypothetical protein
MTTLLVSFETWKKCLRNDCEHNDKLQEFDILGESVLRILWEARTEPSVQGIIIDGAQIVLTKSNEIAAHHKNAK